MVTLKLKFWHGANRHADTSIACCSIDLDEIASWLEQTEPRDVMALFSSAFGECRTACNVGEKTVSAFARALAEQFVEQQKSLFAWGSLAPAWTRILSQNVVELYFGFEREDVAITVVDFCWAQTLSGLDSSGVECGYDSSRVSRVVAQFRLMQRRLDVNYSMTLLLHKAAARAMPIRVLMPSTVILGEGRFAQRRYRGFSERTGYLGFHFSMDKPISLAMLESHGFPVPRQMQVNDREGAVSAAHRIGYPVVVKPADADFGYGVSPNLHTDDEVRAAWSRARKIRPLVVVEQQIPGADYRILVIDGKFICAAERRAPILVGDGSTSIRDLLGVFNADPDRGPKGEKLLVQVPVDDELVSLLSEQGYNLDDVPKAGIPVRLCRVPSRSRGGHSVDVTERVHRDNRALAQWAARLFRINECGIDFITPDISRSFREVGGAFCEINACPGLEVHLVAEGNKTDVVRLMLEQMFPLDAPFLIRKFFIIGAQGSAEATRLADVLARGLRKQGHCVGISNFGDISIDEHPIASDRLPLPAATKILSTHPAVDAAIVIASPEQIESHGLGLQSLEACFVAQDIAENDATLQLAVKIARNCATTVCRAAGDNTIARVLQAS